jgi:hypothetical protein
VYAATSLDLDGDLEVAKDEVHFVPGGLGTAAD